MRVLSGIQASGTLHLGNYFGAMKQHIEDQERHECFFFIANYHSLNTVQDAELLRKLTRNVALDYLAMGLAQRATLHAAGKTGPTNPAQRRDSRRNRPLAVESGGSPGYDRGSRFDT